MAVAAEPTARIHTVVAMSGGVDSSVAALILKRTARPLAGLYMKNWDDGSPDADCPWQDEVEDVLAVADVLGIPVNTIDLTKDYWAAVFEDFLAEYRRGRTPNPDVLCNREIKFKAFLDAALDLGAECIATGHYVRSEFEDGRYRLLRGRDPGKDQSYFLYTLGQAQLQRAVFPLGDLTKAEVRALARETGLPVHDKKDSTGICFIGEREFRPFLARYLPAQPGAIETLDGTVIGQHPGAVYFTLGQRQGLGIGGVRGASEAPWYVVAKDVRRNVLTVAQGHDHPAMMSTRLVADSLSWVAGEAPAWPLRCSAKTRYRQVDQPCTAAPLDDTRVEVRFDTAQRAVTPGQSVVFYQGDRCLGGGIIDATA